MFARMLFKSGLGLGIGLNYFLDPDQGPKRRDRMLRQAKVLGKLVAQAADTFLPGRVGTVTRRVLKTWDLTPRRAPGLVAVGLGSMAAGAGMVYFLDAERGAERRARLERQMTGALERTRELFAQADDVIHRAEAKSANPMGASGDQATSSAAPARSDIS